MKLSAIRSTFSRIVASLPFLLLLLCHGQANAQASIEVMQHLSFGNTFPGIQTAVQPEQISGRGHFRIRMETEMPDATLRLMLPHHFTSGNNTIPIAFGTRDLAIQTKQEGIRHVDPSTSIRIEPGSSEILDFYLGGSVLVPVSAQPGVYSAVISISISYGGL